MNETLSSRAWLLLFTIVGLVVLLANSFCIHVFAKTKCFGVFIADENTWTYIHRL